METSQVQTGSKRRRFWISLILLLVAATACYVVTSPYFHIREPSRSSGLRIEPQVIDWTGREILHYEPVSVDFVITNDLDSPVRITGLTPSCQCTLAVLERGEPPFQIASGDRVKCKLSLNPHGKLGSQHFYLTVNSDVNGSALAPLKAEWILTVQRRLSVFPSQVALGTLSPGKPVTAIIQLGDTLSTRKPANIVSNPAIMEISHRAMEAVVGSGDSRWLLRGELEIRVTPKGKSSKVQELVTVHLDDGTTLNIPVFGWVKQPFEFIPERLTLNLRALECAKRTVFFQFSEAEDSLLEIDSAPTHVEVKVEDFDKTRKFVHLTCRLPQDSKDSNAEVVFRAGRSHSRFALPIRIEEVRDRTSEDR